MMKTSKKVIAVTSLSFFLGACDLRPSAMFGDPDSEYVYLPVETGEVSASCPQTASLVRKSNLENDCWRGKLEPSSMSFDEANGTVLLAISSNNEMAKLDLNVKDMFYIHNNELTVLRFECAPVDLVPVEGEVRPANLEEFSCVAKLICEGAEECKTIDLKLSAADMGDWRLRYLKVYYPGCSEDVSWGAPDFDDITYSYNVWDPGQQSSVYCGLPQGRDIDDIVAPSLVAEEILPVVY